MATDTAKPSLADSPRIFENDFLDKYSRIHHWTPVKVYGPIFLALLVYSIAHLGLGRTLEGLCAGYLIWTLTEYVVHRFLFHWEMKSALGARLHFLMHGIHHDYPNDQLRLVMPLLMSLPGGLIAGALIIAAFGGSWTAVLAGFAIGYMIYDSLHYHLHHGAPRTKIGRWVKRAHMMHHFREPHTWYGVSCPWLDYVFGTAGGL